MSLNTVIKDVYAPLNRNPSRKDLVQFGLIVLVGAGVIGALCRYYPLFSWMHADRAPTPTETGGGVHEWT